MIGNVFHVGGVS